MKKVIKALPAYSGVVRVRGHRHVGPGRHQPCRQYEGGQRDRTGGSGVLSGRSIGLRHWSGRYLAYFKVWKEPDIECHSPRAPRWQDLNTGVPGRRSSLPPWTPDAAASPLN